MASVEESLRRCEYIGDISALCLLPRLPYLLAGSGSELRVYHLHLGTLLSSFFVFQGVRVHGISCCDALDSRAQTVVVFGERRVKLFALRFDQSNTLHFTISQCLPKFATWVLDVRFFQGGASPCLAVGCSDNSVHIWSISESRVVVRVQPSERSLLYSMRLWGDTLETLRIASGTIFNEIIVWKVIPQNNHCDQMYEAVHTCKLVGHEGSIFGLAWSDDGSKLVSVSDDRCARIWEVRSETDESSEVQKSVVLSGHSARVWDCCIYDTLVVTAGEDCTCRVWDFDGKQLQVIKEHVGRGIWRCLYDPHLSLIVTAGFDSSIKVHQLNTTSLSGSLRTHPEEKDSAGTSMCMIRIPFPSDHVKLMDSKSEYVRCLRFMREDTLYVATNHGYVYHAKLSESGNVSWTEIVHVGDKIPIICMDIFSTEFGDDDWIAVGDGKGNMTVVKVGSKDPSLEIGCTFSWSAGQERRLLGTHWCKPLQFSYVFTADPKGTLKLWRLCNLFETSPRNTDGSNASLVAEFTSNFGLRIMCLDASLQNEVLVCGDIRGNLALFPLSNSMLERASVASDTKVSASKYFKGAHGISTVTSVAVVRLNPSEIEIRSTGGDGCICFLKYDRERQHLEFRGMKQVKDLNLIQSVCCGTNSISQSSTHYAAGFTSIDFMIWNFKTQTKILQIPCGGWRRPHCYFVGDLPELKNCFAYVKDEVIHVHRQWVEDDCRQIYPQNLHMQFHGREMHSLCFIATESLPVTSGSSWVATGCEDGTVRLTRYSPGFENWRESKLLGEHVGGSAVRAICFASKMHFVSADLDNGSEQGIEDPFLLISVGAKRVLTSWLLRNRKLSDQHGEAENGSSSMEFQWLSTDMPPKYSATNKSMETTCSANTNVSKEDERMELKFSCEDDWRYLAVTAFLVKCAGSRLTVCFVVVACSDATLVLRALILPLRLWFDVALLVRVSSPVLALQHVVIPGNIQNSNVYIAISGATDGSIAFWDLSKSVEAFMDRVSVLKAENMVDCQKRPRTGRGSQGGRQWRSLGNTTATKSDEESCRDDSSVEILPVRVLKKAHQSGVNCLHVSKAKAYESCKLYTVVSGGDDQALQCVRFGVTVEGGIRVVNCEKLVSAHSAAIKGMWTDGSWVFSTGVDQRIRSWRVEEDEEHWRVKEHSNVVMSVPEPEALDAILCTTTGQYRIAVAGRGMQMAHFNST